MSILEVKMTSTMSDFVSGINNFLKLPRDIVIKWDEAKREIHCGCCPTVFKNDNVENHVNLHAFCDGSSYAFQT